MIGQRKISLAEVRPRFAFANITYSKMQMGLEELNCKFIYYTRKLGWPIRTPYAHTFAYRVLIGHPSFLVYEMDLQLSYLMSPSNGESCDYNTSGFFETL